MSSMSADQVNETIRQLINEPPEADKWHCATREGLISENQALEHRTREIIQERTQLLKGEGPSLYWCLTIKSTEYQEEKIFASSSHEEARHSAQVLIDEVGFRTESILIQQAHMTPSEYAETITKWMRLRGWFKANPRDTCDSLYAGPRGGVYRMSGTGRSRIYL